MLESLSLGTNSLLEVDGQLVASAVARIIGGNLSLSLAKVVTLVRPILAEKVVVMKSLLYPVNDQLVQGRAAERMKTVHLCDTQLSTDQVATLLLQTISKVGKERQD